ncbi:MAG: Gfo/Idh/MocA family oxidoreductase [Victivallaceae bacterium]|nr:Gfo/Idh/MocA family oxidoreductase [Victivallaceae bacterium]
MTKKLKVAVIGLGMGRVHIDGYRQHEHAEIVAVADLNRELLDRVGTELKIGKRYTDPLEMLAKVKPDVVSIAVPNKFHRPLAIAALEAGAQVLCEKPMAMNTAEAEEMLAAARKTGNRLGINFSFRFTPQSFAMKRLVEAGELGGIYFARTVWQRRRGLPGFGGWFGQKALSGGGPLIDLGVHRLDLALWLMDYPQPEWVMGSTYNHLAAELAAKEGRKFDVEDFACGLIKFKNGATLELEASWAGNIRERELMSTRLLGTKGGLYQYNLDEGYEFQVECYQEKNGCHYDLRLHPPVAECKNAYYSFIDALIKDKPFSVSPEQGVTVMKLLDALYQSASTGKPVKIK